MDTALALGFKDLFTHLIGDMTKAVGERAGETERQQIARSQIAAHAIMAFMPRDMIEAMLAGHCMMFHELIVDSIRDTMRGEANKTLRAARGNIVAMDRAFGNNLDRLERYQNRRAEGRRDASEAQTEDALAETEIADRVSRHRAETPPREAAKHIEPVGTQPSDNRDVAANIKPSSLKAEAIVPYRPAPAAIAACMANPKAMQALNAGDAAGFAQALGVRTPNKDYLAAASSLSSPFQLPAKGSQPPVVTGSPRVARSDEGGSHVRQMADDALASK